MRFIIISAALVLLIAAGIGGYFMFFRYKADLTTASQYISTQATVAYKNSSGDSLKEISNTAQVRKVDLFSVAPTLKGASVNSSIAAKQSAETYTLTLIDPDSAVPLGSVNFTVDANGKGHPDWTAIASVDPNKVYDVRISAPGYLSRMVTGQNVSQLKELLIDPEHIGLRPGDVDGNPGISFNDYYEWKKGYGQNVTNDPRDFNGDGTIDYIDYAISFGSCYGVTEMDQDKQCR